MPCWMVGALVRSEVLAGLLALGGPRRFGVLDLGLCRVLVEVGRPARYHARDCRLASRVCAQQCRFELPDCLHSFGGEIFGFIWDFLNENYF